MEKIDISSNIKGIHLSSCIMNASGALCSSEKELLNLMNSSSGALITKSCTYYPRIGNEKPRYFEWSIGSINSMGLPNLGIDFYIDFFEKKDINKPIFLSISGFSMEENISILKKSNRSSKITAIELNLSCPNNNIEILGYNLKKVVQFLTYVFHISKKPIGVKLPPYFTDRHIKNMSSILNQFPISFVTCVNSVPNGMYIDIEKESVIIRPNQGFGGIGGKMIKPFALSNISKFYSYLKKNISIIGCGGISSGKDIFEHILCGANAVQIGTKFINEGITVFDRLRKELIEFLEKKNYKSINDFKGKLKTIDK
ncbi:dihydroorotate oxidase [Blattabacterium cuenoti]|uniref:dihydroorotate oxidase n=1 Tax=Blattabacterium cuenoti TaxID=1653831 RepID=UPI00163CE2AF|nr:dihydroorotate oxidase [Blattabacterium cuenoti]